MPARAPNQELNSATSPREERDRWTVPDLIDFDYYVDGDERALREDPAERRRLTQRDRAQYLENIRGELPGSCAEHSPAHRRLALRRWLAHRRGGEAPALRPLLPGESFARAQRLVTLTLGGIGCILGAGVAATLLSYDGSKPVNVAWYLLVLVLLQLLLAVVTSGMWALRRSRLAEVAIRDLSLLSHVVRPLFSRVAGWIQSQRLAHVPAGVREQAKSEAGLLQSHYVLYGPASYLPVLIAAQVFGIGFNVGAISTTVALEWFSDLAFGWGSALDVQPSTIHGLVQLVALPWGWAFGEGVGYPSLEQIAGSRIFLKDPLWTLNAADLRAWRWFLVLAVATYGLLPRLALLGFSVLIQRRTLAALPFTHQRTQALYARMVTPSMETAIGSSGAGPEMPIPRPLEPPPTSGDVPSPGAAVDHETAPSSAEDQKRVASGDRQGAAEGAVRAKEKDPEQREGRRAPKAKPRPGARSARKQPVSAAVEAIAADACVLMVHVDVADLLSQADQSRLQGMLRAHSGWRVAATITFGGGSAMADQAMALVRDRRWDAPPPRIAIVQDGSQPPITEDLRFLRAVRAQAGEQAPILLALVGDAGGDDPLPPVTEFDFADWQRKIEQLADPYLRLEMLAPAWAEAPN